MTRWEPNAADRLADAALELFEEHGYERTTVDEIARAAGLTRRTFFRHFADKREVLFGGGTGFADTIVAGIAAAPADAAPLDAIAAGLAEVGTFLQGRHAYARRRAAVIAASPELQERELVKLASVTVAVAEALRERGLGDPDARLAAEAGMGAFRVAFDRWTAKAGPMPALVEEAIGTLRAVATPR